MKSSWKLASSLPQLSCAYWVLMTTHTELPFLCIDWQLIQIPCLTNTHISGARSQAGSPVFDSSKFSFTWCSNVRTWAQCNGNTKQQSWEVLFTILLGHTKLTFCNFLSFTIQQSWKTRCKRKDGFKPNFGSDTKLLWFYILTYSPQCVAAK
jgi:hypothetical protein